MPRKQAQTRAATLDAIEAALAAPPLLAINCTLYVHTARDDGPGAPCPCCGSRFAYVSEERFVDTLIVHTGTRKRALRSETFDTLEFDRLASSAKQVNLTLRCSDWTCPITGYSEADILLDRKTSVWIAGGANRSGKSQLGVSWLILRWLWRGSRTAFFRVIGPEIKQAHIIKRKLVEGEGESPPALPPELVISYPEHERTQNQVMVMCDGSQIHLTHGKSAKHLKGVAVTDTLWTEVTECPLEEVFSVSRARHTSTGGQMYLDSTPKRGHWMLNAVEIAQKQLEGHQKGGDPPRYRAISKPIDGNPWLDPREVAAAWEDAKALDPIMARREFGGEWVGGNALMFEEAWDGDLNTVDLWTADLSEIGLIDVTRQASRAFWRGEGRDWVIGVDVNRNPHTAVVCKVFEHPAHKGVRGLLVFDEIRTWNADAYEAAKNLANDPKAKQFGYENGCIAIDANAAHPNQHAAHTGGRATTPIKDYERYGFLVRPNKSPKGKPYNPDVRDSSALLRHMMRTWVGPSQAGVRRLLVNAAYAHGTIKAVENQQDRGDGRPVKEANTASDRMIAAYTDSLRYLVWPLFAKSTYSKPAKVLMPG